jgi:hypothetical protein
MRRERKKIKLNKKNKREDMIKDEEKQRGVEQCKME